MSIVKQLVEEIEDMCPKGIKWNDSKDLKPDPNKDEQILVSVKSNKFCICWVEYYNGIGEYFYMTDGGFYSLYYFRENYYWVNIDDPFVK